MVGSVRVDSENQLRFRFGGIFTLIRFLRKSAMNAVHLRMYEALEAMDGGTCIRHEGHIAYLILESEAHAKRDSAVPSWPHRLHS